MQEGVPVIKTGLSIHGCDGYVVVTLRGELDIADAKHVTAVLAAVAAREPEIVVDLADLAFIDSSGVAALAHGREQARQAGGDLLLAAPQQQAMRILAVAHMAERFSVYASAEEASGVQHPWRQPPVRYGDRQPACPGRVQPHRARWQPGSRPSLPGCRLG
jgi:anti-anti-sigma factor